jgi:NADPH:quinone reductase-like Zn-dependent oxidoreductase
MKAIVFRRYWSPDALELVDIPAPTPASDQVVVRVIASSVNPVDWHRLRGRPILVRLSEGLTKPRNEGIGADVAGVVERVGSEVTNVKVGDEVLGMGNRTWAEQVAIKAEGVVPKPAGLSFEQAGAVGVAGITALQGVRDKGHVATGQRVLVHGAGGGVGSFAVQIATSLGAEVIAATSADKIELVRSLGPRQVIDYAAANGVLPPGSFDVIFNAGGWLSLAAERRLLRPGGIAVNAGAGRQVTTLGVFAGMAAARAMTRVGSRRFTSFYAQRTQADLLTLRSMLEVGSIRVLVDRRYPLAEVADAVRYQETGRAAGKVVVVVAGEAG